MEVEYTNQNMDTYYIPTFDEDEPVISIRSHFLSIMDQIEDRRYQIDENFRIDQERRQVVRARLASFERNKNEIFEEIMDDIIELYYRKKRSNRIMKNFGKDLLDGDCAVCLELNKVQKCSVCSCLVCVDCFKKIGKSKCVVCKKTF